MLTSGWALQEYNPFITLIGHSMGGIVARGLFDGTDAHMLDAIATIITVATPHRPVAVVDYAMDNYYWRIKQVWGDVWGMAAGSISHHRMQVIGADAYSSHLRLPF